MKISHYVMRHPVVIAMITIALVAFGFYCLYLSNVEFISDLSLSSIEVVTVYPGASAEEVERDVTKVLEDDFVTLPNFKSVNSTNQNSFSWITINFTDDVDPYDQLDEIRYRIDQLLDSLPANIQGKPMAMVGGSTMIPIFEFSVSGGKDTGHITRYLNDEIVPRLTKIDGVGSVTIIGGDELEVEVKLRLDDLQSKGISVLEVFQLLNYSNAYLPLGEATYEGKNVTFNYEGGLRSPEDIGDLTVGMGSDHVVVKLRDVADIAYAYPKQHSKIFAEGNPMIVVRVLKRLAGNTMDITKEARRVMREIESETNGALKCGIITDESRTVVNSLAAVMESGALGLVMAIVIVFFFLFDPKATIAIGLSIPLSILFTFTGMQVLGMSINLISTAGIVVAIGMIVDGSIVMLEQVFRNFKNRRLDAVAAINRGADEVSSSILASVLTTVVVFIPMFTLKGIVGLIVKDFAKTLVICLLASLLVALVFVPFILRLFFGKKHPKTRDNVWFNRGYLWVERTYKKGLAWCLAERKFVILIPIFFLLISLMLVSILGYSFIPSVDNGDFYAEFEFPVGYSGEMTEEKMKVAEKIIRREVPEIENMAVYSGQSPNIGEVGAQAMRIGYAHIILPPADQRDRKISQIVISLQKTLSEEMVDCKVNVKNGGFDYLLAYLSEGGGYQISLVGTDVHQLYKTALDLEKKMKSLPEVVTTAIDTNFDSVNVVLDMAREHLNSLGISSYEAGIVSRILFSGLDAGKITDEATGKRYNINLTSDASDQPITEDLLSKLTIKTLGGGFVSFAGLGDYKVENTINAIKHRNRMKSVSVSASLVGDDASGVNNAMNKYLEEHPLPKGVETVGVGTMKLITDSLGQMVSVLIIGIFLVYMVMVIQFERFRQPFIIMMSIPFAVIGVITGLLVFGSNLNLISVVAVISLAGVVVNNAIIMIDYMNLLRDRKRAAWLRKVDEAVVDTPDSPVTHDDGFDKFIGTDLEMKILHESVTEGGSSRLRPILMTTLTTMFGVFPMALSFGAGAELYAPVGQAIFGGLLTSTLVTLFLIPVVYYSMEKKSIIRKARRLGGDDEQDV